MIESPIETKREKSKDIKLLVDITFGTKQTQFKKISLINDSHLNVRKKIINRFF